jgi:phosphonopyruvate decarboxylase
VLQNNKYPLSREQAADLILANIGRKDVIISTTGFLSREIYEVRKRKGESGE